MTVKQTLSLDDCIRLLAEMAEEAEGKRDAADNRASATTGAVKVMEENERDRYAQEHEALTRAIAIIKAAQAVVDNAFPENVTPSLWRIQVYIYKVFEKPMNHLISLISPEQEQKKGA